MSSLLMETRFIILQTIVGRRRNNTVIRLKNSSCGGLLLFFRLKLSCVCTSNFVRPSQLFWSSCTTRRLMVCSIVEVSASHQRKGSFKSRGQGEPNHSSWRISKKCTGGLYLYPTLLKGTRIHDCTYCKAFIVLKSPYGCLTLLEYTVPCKLKTKLVSLPGSHPWAGWPVCHSSGWLCCWAQEVVLSSSSWLRCLFLLASCCRKDGLSLKRRHLVTIVLGLPCCFIWPALWARAISSMVLCLCTFA